MKKRNFSYTEIKVFVGEVVRKHILFILPFTESLSSASTVRVHPSINLAALRTAVFLFTKIRPTASHIVKIIATISGIPHPRISFENGGLTSEQNLLCIY